MTDRRGLYAAAEAAVDAPAETVQTVLRDFHTHHPRILPPAFSNLVVEEGGRGAGTRLSFDLTLAGRTVHSQSRIEEPSEGVMEEHIVGREMVTTFTVTPRGERSVVRIETSWTPERGLAGLGERLFLPRMFRSIYRQELRQLDAYARQVAAGSA